MGYVLTSPPTTEPISLATAKLHLRVDFTDDDALITALITASRMYAEQITRSSFITQTWKYVMDSFPGGLGMAAATPWGETFTLPPNAILLEKGPVTVITGITYLDMAGATQTMPTTDYVAELSGPMARVTPVFGKIWPITMPQIGSASITFTAGYGNAAAVPLGLCQWMLLRIGALYENREEVVSGRGIKVDPLPFVDSLLEPYTLRMY